MAKGPSFNFGANKAKKTGKGKSGKKRTGKGKNGSKGNGWRAYVNSNAPIPD